ncbi:MAG: undecaprenyl-diphosphate phosphatase [Alphaproteobacteria bacterium]|nr:undecaprenyl-diphosphate phosphatase [Alphaproteobacteria bacterium]
MYLYHIVILALVQGISEFLPISSSAHLILAHGAMDDPANADPWGAELTMDVAVHVGTLLSVLLYFRKDIADMLGGTLATIRTRKPNEGLELGVNMVIASAPVIIVGLWLATVEPDWLRSIAVIGWTTLIFGIVLGVADKFFPVTKKLEDLTFGGAFLIGLAQAIALVPGVSRSGITMTAGRFLGYNRADAARFSLLLSIIAISGAGALQGLELVSSGDLKLGLNVLIAAILAFLSGWAAITLMMRWLSKATFTPFVIYRVALGLLLLGLYYGGYGF